MAKISKSSGEIEIRVYKEPATKKMGLGNPVNDLRMWY